MEYSFQDFSEDIDRIVWEIKAQNKKYDRIVGLVKGGCVPSIILSHKICGRQSRPTLLYWCHQEKIREHNEGLKQDISNGAKVLLVVEYVDTGMTVEEILDQWKCSRSQVDVACCVYNQSNDYPVDFFGRRIDKTLSTEWIDFWWEKK